LLKIAHSNGNQIDVVRGYESRHGRPPAGTAAKLQAASKLFLSPVSWTTFFGQLRIAMPSKAALCNILRWAQTCSERRGYHTLNGIDLRKLRSRRNKLESLWAKSNVQSQHAMKTNMDGKTDDVCAKGGSNSSDSDSNLFSMTSTSSEVQSASSRCRTWKLVIKGLQPSMTEQKVRQVCASFGYPICVQKYAGDRDASVWFTQKDEATAAQEYLRELQVCGRKIRTRVYAAHKFASTKYTSYRPAQRKHQGKCPYHPLSSEAKQWYKTHRGI